MSKKKKKKGSDIKQYPNSGLIPVYGKKQCHNGPIEVWHNIWLGSLFESKAMADMKLEVLVPMDSMYGTIWDKGWRGEILYYPCSDYSVLPDDVALDAISKIIERYRAGKKIGIFCVGGHGRSATLVALIIGKISGMNDPIDYLRTNYCPQAIESNEQIRQIGRLLNSDLKKYETTKSKFSKWDRNWGYSNDSYGCYDYGYGYGYDDYSYKPAGSTVKELVSHRCKSCVLLEEGCELDKSIGYKCSKFLSLSEYLQMTMENESPK